MVRDISFYPGMYKLSAYKKKSLDSDSIKSEDLEKIVAFIKE